MRRVAVIVLAATVAALASCKAPPAPKEYVYPAWGFAVSFRVPPKETSVPGAPDGSSVPTFTVEHATEGRNELVHVLDGSSSSKSDEDALNGAPAKVAASVNGTLGPLTYAATGKVIGVEFLLTKPDKSVAKVRVFVFHKHLYEVIARSGLGPDDPESTRFLDSFRLL
jgi:hypothetical protein